MVITPTTVTALLVVGTLEGSVVIGRLDGRIEGCEVGRIEGCEVGHMPAVGLTVGTADGDVDDAVEGCILGCTVTGG